MNANVTTICVREDITAHNPPERKRQDLTTMIAQALEVRTDVSPVVHRLQMLHLQDSPSER